METTGDKFRAFFYAIAIHLVCFGLMFVGLLWSQTTQSVSVAGGSIEATLVAAPPSSSSAKPTPPAPPSKPEPRETAPPPQPKPEPVPQEAPEEPQLRPQAPQPKPDTVDQQAAALLSAQKEAARVKQEQEERVRQEQILLDQQKQEEAERKQRLSKMEQEQQVQLNDIRRRRAAAEKARKLEEQKLQQLADARSATAPQPAPAAPQRAPSTQPPSDRLGNGGADDGLGARYSLAIRQAVTQNWLRPDSAHPGIVCKLRIVQIPGGEVIQVSVTSPCNADDLTRRSIEAAVLKAQPLPYRGYESVFSRSIEFTFKYDG